MKKFFRVISFVSLFPILLSQVFAIEIQEELKQSLDNQNKVSEFSLFEQEQVNNELPYVDGEVLVKFKPSKTKNTFEKNIQSKGLLIEERLKTKNTFVVSSDISSPETTQEIIQELQKDPLVEYAQPNFIYSTEEFPNDTNFQDLWGLHNSGQSVNSSAWTIDADTDWLESNDIYPLGVQNQSIVAVIDTGVNYLHEDLQNQMWDGSNCVDQNGSPLWSCIHGYDFDDNDTDPMPTSSDHGTHVAGTIAAESNNWKGITWVAPSTKIMAIKWFETSAQSVDAINFARQNGAKIINASWGGDFLAFQDCSNPNLTPIIDMALYNAIADFKNSGGIFIAAAGNDNLNHDTPETRHFPAGFWTNFQCGNQNFIGLDNIISVAATNSNDQLAYFSDYGQNSVHIGAPGVSVKSSSELTTYSYTPSDLISDSFFSYSTGAFVPPWISSTGSLMIDTVFWSKSLLLSTEVPYMTGSHIVAASIPFNTSLYDNTTLDFWVDCDIDPSETWDYLELSFSQDGGQNFNTIKRWDNNEASYSFGLFWTGSLENWTGSLWDRYTYDFWDSFSTEIDMSTYSSQNFVFRFDWVSDEDDIRWAGCAIDNIDFTWYTQSSQTSPKYVFKSGTSMAAPHVTGLASLLKSYKSSLTYQEIKDSILNFWDTVASLVDKTTTGKRINVFQSLNSLRSLGSININFAELNKEPWQVVPLTIELHDTYGFRFESFSWVLDFTWSTDSWVQLLWLLSSGSISFSPDDKGQKTLTGALIFSQLWEQSFSLRESLSWVVGNATYDVSYPSIPQGNLSFTKARTNLKNQSITLSSSEYPVSYEIFWDISQTLTGILLQESQTQIQLSPEEWTKTVVLYVQDSQSNHSSYTWSVTLDTTAPSASIMSSIPPYTPSKSIEFSLSQMSEDIDTNSIIWSQNFDSSTSQGPIYTLSGVTSNSLQVSARFQDTAGNTTNLTSSGYIIDNSLPDIGIAVEEGNVVNTRNIKLNVSSSKYPVDYLISGDISSILTGSLQELRQIPTELTSDEGEKSINIAFSDSLWNTNFYHKSIILDTTSPQIFINSHQSGAPVMWESITLTWMVLDQNQISSFSINSVNIPFQEGKWEYSFNNMVPWINTLNFRVQDIAGNISEQILSLQRIPLISQLEVLSTSPYIVELNYHTDISTASRILFGKNSQNLHLESNQENLWNQHKHILTSLETNTEYFYQIENRSSSWSLSLSPLYTFSTPQEVSSSNVCSGQELQGSMVFTGSLFSQSWAQVDCNKTLTLVDNSGKNKVSFSLQNFHVIPQTSDWEGFFTPPIAKTSSGQLQVSPWYQVPGSVFYVIGDYSTSLNILGSPVEVSIFVGEQHNGKIYSVFHSSHTWQTYQYHSNCTVSLWYCNFQTNSFSYYTLAEWTDDTPDVFSFSWVVQAELSKEYLSHSITIQGITKPAPVSIVGWEYKIGNNPWTQSSWFISNGESLQVKTQSSDSYNTSTQATLIVWGYEQVFQVQTTSAPISYHTGWGGWGGGGKSQSSCTQEQLICQSIQWKNLWQKKENISCNGGNLWKSCDKSAVETKSFSGIVSQIDTELLDVSKFSPEVQKILKQEAQQYAQLAYISQDFYERFSKDISQQSQSKVAKKLILGKKIFETEIGKVETKEVQWEAFSYIVYADKRLSTIQKSFIQKMANKEYTKELFQKEQSLLYILYTALLDTQKSKVTKNQIQDAYKQYKDLVPLSSSKKLAVKKQEEMSLEISQDTQKHETIWKVLKLASDKEFTKLWIWVYPWDTYIIQESFDNEDILHIKVITSEKKKNEGKEGYLRIADIH